MSKDSRVRQGLTANQKDLVWAALTALLTFDRVIPQTTVHYAVEEARIALRRIHEDAPNIVTQDVKAERDE